MRTASILKCFFCFKKPRVVKLSYLPVLVKDKPVLFVAWEIKHAWSVRFIPLRQKHNAARNAAIVSVPNHLKQVTLKAGNCWRTTTIRLSLHAVQLDEAGTAHLIDGFRPLHKTAVHTPVAAYINSPVLTRPLNIQQRNSSIQQVDRFKVAIQPLTVSIQPIHYQ